MGLHGRQEAEGFDACGWDILGKSGCRSRRGTDSRWEREEWRKRFQWVGMD